VKLKYDSGQKSKQNLALFAAAKISRAGEGPHGSERVPYAVKGLYSCIKAIQKTKGPMQVKVPIKKRGPQR